MSQDADTLRAKPLGLRFAAAAARILFVVCGVILPLMAVGVELSFGGLCRSVFLDPIPTPWHIALIAIVPLANLLAWRTLRGKGSVPLTLIALLQGSAAAVSFIYAIVFLPMLPLALLYSAMSFMALFVPLVVTSLPCSPLLALLATLHGTRRLSREFPEQHNHLRPVFWLGAGSALLLLVAVEFPRAATRISLERLASSPEDPAAAAFARRFADPDIVLQAAYGHAQASWDLLSSIAAFFTHPDASPFGNFERSAPTDANTARRLYFQLTGTPFNAVPRPAAAGGLFDEFWAGAREIGGAAVGSKANGLFLTSSTIDGSIDAQAALSYTEWTFVFKNNERTAQEARFELELPAGGVVSRAVLWINGKEQEAVFAERAKVREAYEKVVRASRDPLLVTSPGPGRVLVQCFPIQPGGGEMQIRLGITAPLQLALKGSSAGAEEARTHLPRFLSYNFAMSGELRHSVWFESKAPLHASSSELLPESRPDKTHALRGTLASDSGELDVLELTADREPGVQTSWSLDIGSSAAHVRQTHSIVESRPFDHLVLVVDGSQSMAKHAAAIAAAVERLPEDIGISAVIADDQARYVLSPLRSRGAQELAETARMIAQHTYGGGKDNIPGLLAGLELAGGAAGNSVVLWVHGPQPSGFPTGALVQQLARRAKGIKVVSLQLAPGDNSLLSILESVLYAADRQVRRPESDLQPFIDSLTRVSSRRVALRERIDSAETPAGAWQTSQHLARLWAHEEILRLAQDSSPSGREEAVKMAAAYRLVTPVSGAVVLESQAQYQAAGLTPPGTSAEGIPVVPEPEICILLLCAAAALLLQSAAARASLQRLCLSKAGLRSARRPAWH